MSVLANSEDPDEMPHGAAFHQSFTVCQHINQYKIEKTTHISHSLQPLISTRTPDGIFC